MLYYAHDLQADRPVDILFLPLQRDVGSGLIDDLMRVQHAVAGLGEASLVPYEQAGLANGYLYLVRRHVAGQSLARLLAERGPLSARAAVKIAIRICEVLALAHRAGLIHGGLGPDCLFLREGADDDEQGPTLAITDVGLLPALRPAMAGPGQPWGRKSFLSPEQAAGGRIQPTSDVYVIGCLIYLMLTGRPPFRADDERVLAVQHLRQEPPSLEILLPGLPQPLVQIVHTALAKEPAARYRNAGQLAQILRTQLGPQPEHQPPAAPVERARPGPAAVAPGSVPAGPSGGERLMVPPPPRRQPVRRPYELVEDEAWSEEPEGVDWLVVGLLVVAVIAVLGLIPLWQTVYRRYSAPPPLPTPESAAPLPGEMVLGAVKVFQAAWLEAPWRDPLSPKGQMARSMEGCFSPPPPGQELEDSGFLCYNIALAQPIPVGGGTEFGSLGVELTGRL